MAEEKLTNGNDDGIVICEATTEKLAFWGATPVDRPEVTGDAAAVATTAAVSTSTNWGYSGSTQANAIVTLVNALKTDLEALGLLG